MYCDSRLRGAERWYLQRPEDWMTIPEEMRKCVGFIAFQNDTGSVELKGTVFFVGRPADGMGLDQWFCYAVTAKHLIEGAVRKGLSQILIRLNHNNGQAVLISIPISDWVYHPDDPSVDVAACHFAFNTQEIDHKWFPFSASATPDVIEQQKISIGDDLFLVGLFAPHYGREKNIPIVRVGNIAAMPQEKVSTRIGPIDAFLIEARSIGGLSGSPVFVHISGIRHGTLMGGWQFFLLGLMHGHYESSLPGDPKPKNDILQSEAVNWGIAIVIPAEKILETLNHSKLQGVENKAREEWQTKNLPVMDSATDVSGSNEFTKADFEAALRKVSRKIDPPKST